MFKPSQFIKSCKIDDAYDKLHAENKKLREALKNSADDIEASIGSLFMLKMLTSIVVSMRDFADKALKDK